MSGYRGRVLLPLLAACAAGWSWSPAAVFQTAPGRFEIAAGNADEARAITAAADEAWRTLAAPLALPEAFTSPVFLRTVGAAEWREPAPFRTIVEAGGVVSVRIRSPGAALDRLARRAIVQGLLMRLAVAHHGVHERIAAPLWLEHAAVWWWETRADGAQLDAIKQQSEPLTPPTATALLRWQRGEPETVEQSAGAFWLLAFLQAEAAAGEWRALLRRMLAGEDALAALALTFPGRFNHEDERELWWTTGFHHVRRARTLPALRAAESRWELERFTRFVMTTEEQDAIPPLRVVMARSDEMFVDADLQRRATELNRLLPALHPFYRNAGLSLAELLAARAASAAKRERLCAAFERDWHDAVELEAAAVAALDALERR